MKTQQEILDRIEAIKGDERLSYPSAKVDVNALLALTQVSLEAQLHALEWALGLPQTKIPIGK